LSDEYIIGDRVYHRAKEEKCIGIITGITHRANGLTYLVTWGNDLTERWHHAIELTTTFLQNFKE
jgi:hypothetical protein